MTYFPYRNNKRPSSFRNSFYDLLYFFRDFFLTFIQFAHYPLYHLFLYFPKTYERVLLFLSAIRNVLPTKNEIFHTGLHWHYNILKFILTFNRISIKMLIKFSQLLHFKAESIILKYPSYIK